MIGRLIRLAEDFGPRVVGGGIAATVIALTEVADIVRPADALVIEEED